MYQRSESHVFCEDVHNLFFRSQSLSMPLEQSQIQLWQQVIKCFPN